MGKIVFDDGTEVEISKETEENLRKLKRDWPIVTMCSFNGKESRIVVRLSEEAVKNVRNGKSLLIFNSNTGRVEDVLVSAYFPLPSYYKESINYGQLGNK